MLLTARTVTTTQLNQRPAATSLGYTEVSWDNASGNEAQPASASKKWADLTAQEKSAATVLGYTEQTWRTVSATKKTPWSDLTVTTGAGFYCIASFLFDYNVLRCIYKVMSMLSHSCIDPRRPTCPLAPDCTLSYDDAVESTTSRKIAGLYATRVGQFDRYGSAASVGVEAVD